MKYLNHEMIEGGKQEKKTPDILLITDKLVHVRLYDIHLTMLDQSWIVSLTTISFLTNL